MSENNELHKGHRQKMWQKYSENGINGFSEQEILEMLLFMCLPRVDTNNIADKLLMQFGSLKNVLDAQRYELEQIKGIGTNAAAQLCFIGELTNYINRNNKTENQFCVSSSIIDFCVKHFENITDECVSFFLLDDQSHIVYFDDLLCSNDNVINNKEIIRQAVKHECTSMFLSHYCPSENVFSSNADISAIRTLSSLLKSINVTLIDHIIVSDKNGYSLRASGTVCDVWN